MSQSQSNDNIQSSNIPTRQSVQQHDITLGQVDPQRKFPNNDDLTFRQAQNYSIQFQLKNINRQVNKITQKVRHDILRSNITNFGNTSSSLYSQFGNQFNQNSSHDQMFKNFNKINTVQEKQNNFGKYNYYGKKYRFLQQDQNINQKAKEKRQNCCSRGTQLLEQQNKIQKNNNKNNNKISESQSYYIFFENPYKVTPKQNNQQVPSPSQAAKLSHSYHQIQNKKQYKNNPLTISVQNDLKKSYPNHQLPQSKKLRKFHSQLQYNQIPNSQQRQGNTPIPSHYLKPEPQSRWVLEKKVKKLQKQLNEIKRKQEKNKRMNDFVYNKPKNDSKVKVGKQVQNLINSLWP